MNNANTPINPILNADGEVGEMPDGAILSGLTKREYFAGLAMQGLLANEYGIGVSADDCASYAIKYANALLKQLGESK